MKNRNTDPYKKYNEDVKNFANDIANMRHINEDMELTNLVRNETSEIINDISKDIDGNYIDYNGIPVFKVFRDKDSIRVYGLDRSGGIVLIERGSHVKILTLGEDDGSYFLNCDRIYESYRGGHTGFMFLLSEVLSFYNNIEHQQS